MKMSSLMKFRIIDHELCVYEYGLWTHLTTGLACTTSSITREYMGAAYLLTVLWPCVTSQGWYSQRQSLGSLIPDLIKDDSFVLISCLSGPNDLDEESCSLIGCYGGQALIPANSVRLSSFAENCLWIPQISSKKSWITWSRSFHLDHFLTVNTASVYLPYNDCNPRG